MVSAPAFAGKRYQKIPRMDASNTSNGLKLRIVNYSGSTNGGMVVEVRNTSATSRTFVADGLFFVPDMHPDKAPQRLGAAGPFEVRDGKRWHHRSSLTMAPKSTAQLRLQVFCIDSHRASPSSKTRFRLAKKRMPKKLRASIAHGTKRILRKAKKKSARAVPSKVQDHVWETRNKKWIALEGERKTEKSPRKRRPHRRIKRSMPALF